MRHDIHRYPSGELLTREFKETAAEIKLKRKVNQKIRAGKQVALDYRCCDTLMMTNHIGTQYFEERIYELTEVEPDKSVGPDFLRYIVVISGYIIFFALLLKVYQNEMDDLAVSKS